LLLFGAARLPKLARSLRDARDEFQKGSDETPEGDAGMKGAAAAQPEGATPVMKDAAPPSAPDGSAAQPESSAPTPDQS
jgi:Sec-independent protein translocase protein TatA